MQVARADPDEPDLSLGNAGAQLVACRQFVDINLIGPAFDIDGRKLALVLGLELGQDVILVDRVATPGELIFAVAAFGSGHQLPPFLRAGTKSDFFYCTS